MCLWCVWAHIGRSYTLIHLIHIITLDSWHTVTVSYNSNLTIHHIITLNDPSFHILSIHLKCENEFGRLALSISKNLALLSPGNLAVLRCLPKLPPLAFLPNENVCSVLYLSGAGCCGTILGNRNFAFLSPLNLASRFARENVAPWVKVVFCVNKLCCPPIEDFMLYLVGAGLGSSYLCNKNVALLFLSPANRLSLRDLLNVFFWNRLHVPFSYLNI